MRWLRTCAAPASRFMRSTSRPARRARTACSRTTGSACITTGPSCSTRCSRRAAGSNAGARCWSRSSSAGTLPRRRLLDLSHHELQGASWRAPAVWCSITPAGSPMRACRHARTPDVLAELCDELGYEPFAFDGDRRRGRRRLSHQRAALDRTEQRDRLRRGSTRIATCAAARAAAGERPRRWSPSTARGWPRSQAMRSNSRRRTARRCSPCRTAHFAASTPAVSRRFSIACSESWRCPCRRSRNSAVARYAARSPRCSCRGARAAT